MGEIHGSLVRFQAGIVLVIGGNRAAHRKTARDRDAASVAQRLQIGFGNVGVEIVSGKRLACDQDLDGIRPAHEAHRFSLPAAGDRSKCCHD